MATCNLCEDKPAEANGICEACMDTLGIIEMPSPRRRPTPCVKCQGMQFVRVIPRVHGVKLGDRNVAEVAPLTLTQEPKIADKRLGSGKSVNAPTIVLGEGMLETYTCLHCGFVEWYVEDPTEIPIGPEFMSELIDYTREAPYR